MMERLVSLLRGINVGGQNRIPMQGLRQVYTQLGLLNVNTYLQSGNVVFDRAGQQPGDLVRSIEAHLEQAFAARVPVFLRNEAELQAVLSDNPFLKVPNIDSSKLHVVFLYREPDETDWKNLPAPEGIPDRFAPGHRVIYLYCPNGYARTKLSNNYFERKLDMPVTTRNWNTVNALFKLVSEPPKNKD